jgi:hypothetical protein
MPNKTKIEIEALFLERIYGGYIRFNDNGNSCFIDRKGKEFMCYYKHECIIKTSYSFWKELGYCKKQDLKKILKGIVTNHLKFKHIKIVFYNEQISMSRRYLRPGFI